MIELIPAAACLLVGLRCRKDQRAAIFRSYFLCFGRRLADIEIDALDLFRRFVAASDRAAVTAIENCRQLGAFVQDLVKKLGDLFVAYVLEFGVAVDRTDGICRHDGFVPHVFFIA